MHRHDPYIALRSGAYRWFLSAHMLSIIAARMQDIAVGWELYERTNLPAALGMVGLLEFLPVLFFVIPAGYLADTYSRKRQLLCAEVLRTCAAGILFFGALHDWPLFLTYLPLLLTGISNALNMPARASLLSHVVPPHALQNAVTWNSGARQIATMIGPAVSGMVIALSGGVAVPYALCIAFLCMNLCCISLLRPRASTIAKAPFSPSHLLSGLQFIWKTKLMFAAVVLDFFAVFLGGATALLPVFARDILHVGPQGLGLLRAAPPIGALCTALSMAHLPLLRRAGPAMLLAVAGFGVATCIFGLSRSFPLSFLALVLAGSFDTVSVIVRHTLLQLLTPDAMRGRVSAAYSAFISGSNELGDAESGFTAQLFGPTASVVVGGIGTIFVVLAIAWAAPELRQLRSIVQQRDHDRREPELITG